MQQVFAIARLTLKAAFRYRLVVALALILLSTVVLLPLFIKHDGTAAGFTQILLTYTLTLITALLGFSTLWLACGTLARDVEECQMQMIAVKPIPRWKIWVGKWLGILFLNAMLLALSGAAVYGLLQWRAQSLPPEERQQLQNEILVARGSIQEPMPDISDEVEARFQERMKESNVAQMDRAFVRRNIQEQVKSEMQIIPPGRGRIWRMDLGLLKNQLRDKPLFLRTKFYPPPEYMQSTIREKPTFLAGWEVGPANSNKLWREDMMLAAETFHQIQIPPNLYNEEGILTIRFYNMNNQSLLFQLDDGMEVLYPESNFTVNFFRGLGIIFFWLALFAAIGLCAASFLSFPVAAFFSLAILVVGLSGSHIAGVLETGSIININHETGYADEKAWIDYIILPVFRGLLALINLVQSYSPVDNLSSGRSIGWSTLGRAFLQIVLLMGGLFALAGILIFQKRELATAQSG